MINIFRGSSPAMLKPHETDVHSSGALKGMFHATNDRQVRSVMFAKAKVRPPTSCGLAHYRLLGCFYPKLALPDSPRMRIKIVLRQPQRDAVSHVRAFRFVIYHPYLLWAVLFSVIVSTHVGVVVVIFNFVLWFLWLLCLMELDHIINVTQNGPNAVFILHVQLKI